MNRKLLALVLLLSIFIGGCAALDNFFLNEDGTVKADIDKFVDGVEGAGAAVGAVGVPIGYVVSGIAASVGSLLGVYAKMRKGQQEAEDAGAETRVVLKAVVEAIEATKDVRIEPDGPTLEEMVKKLVKEKLSEKDAYLIGKALIAALKGE